MTTLRIIPLLLICASALGQTYTGRIIIGANGVVAPQPTAAAPTFSPDGGLAGVEVTISSATSGASFTWSTNNWSTTNTGATIAVMPTGTVKAFASKSGYNDSAVSTSQSYTNPPAPSSLINGLVGYWSFDGTYADDHSTNTLYVTNAASTPFVSGAVHSQAVNLQAGTAIGGPTVSRATGSAFTWMVWAKPTNANVEFAELVGASYGGAGPLYIRDSNRQRMSGNTTTAETSASLSAGSWYLFVGGYDGTNIWLSVNNGARVAVADACSGTSGVWVSPNSTFTGSIGPVAYWSKMLEAAEVSQIYNSGSGLPYSSW